VDQILSLCRWGGKDRVVPVPVKRIGSQPDGVHASRLTVRPEGYQVRSSHARTRSRGGDQIHDDRVAEQGLTRLDGALRRGCLNHSVYWFTPSTSFAHPAVALARSATDIFAGIRPSDAAGFIGAQLLGATPATALFRSLLPTLPESAPDVIIESSGTR